MVWGFFKKLVIADNVGVIANKVFALSDPSFEMLWAGVFAFAIQIYADFSAYTDIARGIVAVARVRADRELRPSLPGAHAGGLLAPLEHLAVDVVPRLRLHPARRLARRRDGTWARNVLITFLLSGLWHGASWNYVLWGLYHGVLLVMTRRIRCLRGAEAATSDVSTSAVLRSLAADPGDVRADPGRLAAVPRNGAAGDRARSDARRRGTARRSSGRRGSICSCSRSAIRSRCGRRASGSSCTAASRQREPEAGWGIAVLKRRRLRRGLHRDPRPAQPHVARLHLLPVLARIGGGTEQRAERDAVGGVSLASAIRFSTAALAIAAIPKTTSTVDDGGESSPAKGSSPAKVAKFMIRAGVLSRRLAACARVESPISATMDGACGLCGG